MRPLRQIIPTSHFSLEELEQAALIYGFDLLTQNSDRRIGKPNSALHNDQIVAFDFELCFSFLLPIIGQKSPWMVSQHGINSRHIFRSMLKRTTPDWSPFIEAVRNLAQNRLDVIQGMMPESWQLWGQQVQEHIKHVIMNIDQFEIELQRSLL